MYRLGWSVEHQIDIQAGDIYTVGVYGWRQGGYNQFDCAGSFTVEIFTGDLE